MWRLAVLIGLTATPTWADGVLSARYEAPTKRYAHGILGDAVEWGALAMTGEDGRSYLLTLPEARVFEDTEPRLVDVDGDGDAEVVVVETDLSLGARLAVYDTDGLVAAGEFIGRPNRWLAPVGVADIDGDGRIEFAYVDRPHLAKRILLLRREGKRLVHFGTFEGVTNHRIGESDIAGGIRDCGDGPEMVVATDDWGQVVSVTFDGARFEMKRLAPHRGRETFAAAMNCRI